MVGRWADVERRLGQRNRQHVTPVADDADVRGIPTDPASADARAVERAAALCELGRPAEAAAVLGPVLAADPHNVDALLMLAWACLRMDDDDEALRAARAAGKLAPDDGEPHLLAALALTGQYRYADAVAAASTAVRLDPLRPSTHQVLAITLLRARKARAAVRAAAEAVRLAPEVAQFRVTLGSALAGAGRRRTALRTLHDALQLDPMNGAAQHELPRITASGRNPLAARPLAEAAISYASVAGADPTSHASATGVDLVLRTFLMRAGMWLWLGIACAIQLVTIGMAPGARVGAAAAVAGAVGFTVRFTRRLPPGLRRYLWSVAGTRGVRGPVSCVLAAGVVLVGVATWPAGAQDAAGPAVTVARVAAMVVVVAGVRMGVAANRYARARGADVPSVLGTFWFTVLALVLGFVLIMFASSAVEDRSVPFAVAAVAVATALAWTIRSIRRRDRRDRVDRRHRARRMRAAHWR